MRFRPKFDIVSDSSIILISDEAFVFVMPYLRRASYADAVVLVTDINGWMLKYDQSLNQIGDGFRVINISVPARQVAVSGKYEAVFTANRGGNRLVGCARTSLSNGYSAFLLSPVNEAMISNTAVAVSQGGDFVAYGYPDGQVWIWDVRVQNTLWADHSIAES